VECSWPLYGAIADHTGKTDFWVCYTPAGRGSGSVHRPTGHMVRTPDYVFQKTENIPCFTLDHIFERVGLDHIDMLWVDIQGAERDMIAGGHYALTRTRYLFIEAEESEQYEGQAVRPELLGLLPAWTVIESFDFNLLLRNEEYDF
jgi:hypothetical protein